MRLLLAAAAGLGAIRLADRLRRRWPSGRRASAAADGDVVVLAELTLLGLSAGLTLAAALAAASRHVHATLAAEVAGLLRRGRVVGMARSLEEASGRAAHLCRIAARAVATGAPLIPAVAAFVDERRHADHALRLAAARRLPVRLLLPLALLILPGFVVLTAGPALLSATERLRF